MINLNEYYTNYETCAEQSAQRMHIWEQAYYYNRISKQLPLDEFTVNRLIELLDNVDGSENDIDLADRLRTFLIDLKPLYFKEMEKEFKPKTLDEHRQDIINSGNLWEKEPPHKRKPRNG